MVRLKIKILNKKGLKLDFIIEGTNPAFVNSLRRTMISEIPVLAVDWIDVENNTSALFDEVISHRIGLMPLKFDPKSFIFSEDCKCKGKGCVLCQAVLVLNKKGHCIVKSGDFKSSNPGVKPLDPNVPIVHLLENQGVKLEAVARLGTGLKHARYQAANASYQYYPEIRHSGPKKDLPMMARECPNGLVSVKGGKLVVNDVLRGDVARSCLHRFKGVDTKGDESRIVFSVESTSGLEPAYIVAKALDIMKGKAEEFKAHVSKI